LARLIAALQRNVHIAEFISFTFLILALLTACGGRHYAPVRSYARDIPKTQKYYVVHKGDTLYAIGRRSGYGYRKLATWNRLKSPYRLEVGEVIKLFDGRRRSAAAFHRKQKTRYQSHKKHKPPHKTRSQSQKNSSLSYVNKKLLKLTWQWPLRGKIVKSFSQTQNKGIDISGKPGQKVRAAASGKVAYSGKGLVGYGNLLIIRHNTIYLSAYANNRRLLVKEGQYVKKGQVVAEVGRKRGGKPSLHFEIRKKGNPVNPLRYLPDK